ncbi:MAG: efflux RND transporter periplasmic adaptor subunit [Planctomycetaceae bacterium]|nr:efflux RND transporter periplasmic adaptor subunit [Planctomycetaceae bacterium]
MNASSPPSRWLRVLAQMALVLLVLAVGVFGFDALVRSRPAVTSTPTPERLPPVEVHFAAPAALQLEVTTMGLVEPRAVLRPAAEVAGTVRRVHPDFAAGNFAREGTVLVELDPREFEMALVEARARVAEAEAAVAREEAEAEVARDELARAGVSEPSPLALRAPQLAQARAALEAARARAARAELDLERTTWAAPVDVRVDRRAVEVGQYVRAGDPLGELFAVDAVEVRLPLSDAELAQLDLPLGQDLGEGIAVELEGTVAGETARWQGRLVRVEGRVEPSTRLVYAVVRVDDPYGLAGSGAATSAPLLVGTFVRARIPGRVIPAAVRLPLVALRGGDEVFVLDDGDRLVRRKVALVARGAREIVVSAGLAAAERVVTSALDVAVDGMRVRPVAAQASGEGQDESPGTTASGGTGNQP